MTHETEQILSPPPPEPDRNLIGCLSAKLSNMGVPSMVLPCSECGEEVLVSIALLDDLRKMGVAFETVEPRCLYTCMTVPDDTPVAVSDGVRAELHALGLTDEQIDQAAAVIASTVIQHEPTTKEQS
jgi:hypothetical protein